MPQGIFFKEPCGEFLGELNVQARFTCLHEGFPWSVRFKGKVPPFTSEFGSLVPENLGFPTMVRRFTGSRRGEGNVQNTMSACGRRGIFPFL